MLLACARQHRLARRVPRRALRRHRAGRGQHAADDRRLRLHAGAQPRARPRSCRRALRRRSQEALAARGARRRDHAGSSPRRGPLAAGQRDFAADVAAAKPAAERAAATHARRLRLLALLVGLDRRAQGHRAHACQRCTGPRRCTARRVLGLREDDVCFSAAKLFFAYGLGNALTFPLFGRRDDRADGRAADAAGRLQALDRAAASDGVLRRADRLTPACSPRPTCRRATQVALRLCSSAGEALPREIGERFKRAFRLRHPRRHRLDRDAAHLPVEPARRRRLRQHRRAGRRATTSSCAATTASPVARRRDRRPLHQRPERGADVLGAAATKSRATFQGEWTQQRRQVRRATSDGRYVYAGPQRRHAEGQRHLRVAVRGRGDADAAPGGARVRRCSASSTPTA